MAGEVGSAAVSPSSNGLDTSGSDMVCHGCRRYGDGGSQHPQLCLQDDENVAGSGGEWAEQTSTTAMLAGTASEGDQTLLRGKSGRSGSQSLLRCVAASFVRSLLSSPPSPSSPLCHVRCLTRCMEASLPTSRWTCILRSDDGGDSCGPLGSHCGVDVTAAGTAAAGVRLLVRIQPLRRLEHAHATTQHSHHSVAPHHLQLAHSLPSSRRPVA